MAAEGEQELDEVQDDLEESHEETEEEGLETGEQLDEAAGELNEQGEALGGEVVRLDDDGEPQGGDGEVMKLDDEGSIAMEMDSEAAKHGNDPMSLPPHGTEVFLGGLPRSATEEDVREFCKQAGTLHSLRLVKDPGNPTQANKGFAFAVYRDKETAKGAVEKLNATQVPGHPDSKPVRVVISSVKNRLFVGNIPKDMTHKELQKEISAVCSGVEAIDVALAPGGGGQNRGFCFVDFYNHAAADSGRRALSPPGFNLRNRALTVTWAEPKRVQEGGGGHGTSEIKAIYVSKLPQQVKSDQLSDIFSKYGNIERIAIPPPKRTAHPEFAFIHYEDRKSALAAVEACQGTPVQLDGAVLEVAMAHCQPESKGPSGPPGRGDSRAPYDRHDNRGRPYPGDRGGSYGGRAGGMGGGGYGAMDYGPPMDLTRMAMVPMLLPNGQIGYVLQDPGGYIGGGGGSYGPMRSSYGSGAGQYGGGAGRGSRGGRMMGRGSYYRPY